jgi:hypothetical protein
MGLGGLGAATYLTLATSTNSLRTLYKQQELSVMTGSSSIMTALEGYVSAMRAQIAHVSLGGLVRGNARIPAVTRRAVRMNE